MSVIHMVWFKWKEGTSAESIKLALDGLSAMKSKIDVIENISVGENFTQRSKGFTHGLLVKLATKEDLAVYANHPDHVAVINNFIAPIKDDIIALDYVEGQY